MRVLLFGSKGAEVEHLQRTLNLTGANIVVDGVFGSLTRVAVKNFQKSHGLLVDGICGVNTWKALSGYSNVGSKDYEYRILSNGLHVVAIDPLQLKLHMENNTGSRIGLKNAMNASFVWWSDSAKTKSYPTSILVYDGKIIQNKQPNGYAWQAKPHYDTGVPTPTFIIYKNGTVERKDVNYFTVFEADKIHLAVSGIDLLPKTRTTGFTPYVPFTSVSYATSRIAIGYDVNDKKVVLAFRKGTSASQMTKLMGDIGCEIAISLDSGGSANYIVDGKKVNATSRWMSAWITW